MKSYSRRHGHFMYAAGLGLAVLVAAPSAEAGVCFTSGKVYVQQKVYDKAAYFLECARREEPENVQVYSLLGVARAQLRQYASAGAVFQLGLKAAADKKDKKRQEEMETNRRALYGQLFNQGVGALNRTGTVTPEDRRTTDAGTPQAAVEKEQGEPKDFARFTEAGKIHEFWYYPDQGLAYHFAPGSTEPLQIPFKPFQAPADPSIAVTDTTAFPAFAGASIVAEAAYAFELAVLVDPTAPDVYKNLSYVYEILGRPDDAIRAAQRGLTFRPDDKQLTQNLRVAAMGRGNRLFNAGKFADAVPAYRAAMAFDSAGTVRYLSLIAEAWQKAAGPMEGAQRTAVLDSAAATYMLVVEKAPADSAGAAMRETSLYNAAVIQVNLEKNKEAVAILDKGMAQFPNSKDILSLAGQTKFATNDLAGSIDAMRKLLQVDPKDPTGHEYLFRALSKQNKKEEAVAEYTIYKALSDGKKRTGSQLKTWVDSAENRLGPGHQLKKTLNAEGYPEEVRTFADGERTLESWFYWSKGKSITFLEGQVFTHGSFPPLKI